MTKSGYIYIIKPTHANVYKFALTDLERKIIISEIMGVQ